ncbi:MAG: PEP-CTERM sorting domain-containing protein, partial [Microcystis panniformis]
NVFLVSPSSPPVSSVPEPSSTLGILGLGVLGIGAALKRKL